MGPRLGCPTPRTLQGPSLNRHPRDRRTRSPTRMGCPVSQPRPDPRPLQPGLEALNDLYPPDELEELVRDGGPRAEYLVTRSKLGDVSADRFHRPREVDSQAVAF